ncbi:MAG: DEAD/DEAH box helicase [bacterium]|nr:DEAD/DEAH box helicase [bacterium]
MNDAQDFFGLGIAPNILDRLGKMGLTKPTPIQEKAIPLGIQGMDLVGIAQTGTGKTLAFSVPMLQRISVVRGKGLVLLPTRELALQVEETVRKLGMSFGLRTAVLIGGASMHTQIQAIRKNPHVIIATPGRLIDHLNQKTVRLDDVKVLVLDEADRMLDMGFAPQIKKILAVVPTDRQTMLFSATMPAEIAQIATKHMKLPVRVEIAPAGTAAERVEQEMFIVQKSDKIRLLEKVLAEYHGTVLVFSRTKFGAKKITTTIRHMGHTAAEIHSNRSLGQRREALEGFKSGKYRVLVATDIAARGIDVTGIELVVNFDLPDHAEDYVHRIGRTARAGRTGKAISFATPDQRSDVQQIERIVRVRLPVSKLPELPQARRPVNEPMERPERTSRSRGRPPFRGFSGGGTGRRYEGRSSEQGISDRPSGGHRAGEHSRQGSSDRSSGRHRQGSGHRQGGYGGAQGGQRGGGRRFHGGGGRSSQRRSR